MSDFYRAILLGAASLTFFAGRVSAQGIDPARVYISGEIHVASDSPFLSVGDRLTPVGNQDQLDYAIFIHELAAYVTKEILRDSSDEYVGTSLIPSHLTTDPVDRHSEFGTHCLTVLGRIRSGLPDSPISGFLSGIDGGSPSVLAYMARAGTALLALRQVWFAYRNDIEDTRSGFSLNPKVGARKLGVSLTFHW